MAVSGIRVESVLVQAGSSHQNSKIVTVRLANAQPRATGAQLMPSRSGSDVEAIYIVTIRQK